MLRPTNELVDEFRRLEARHNSRLVIERAVAVALGPSLIRAFKKGSKAHLIPVLLAVDLEKLVSCRSRQEYQRFFRNELKKIHKALASVKLNSKKHGKGLKWGHATKILCIFLRDLVLYSRYFDKPTAEHLERFLYNPIDGIVIRKLRDLGADPGVRKIKEIDTPKKFWDIQDLLDKAAKLANTIQVRFDDVQVENTIGD